MAISGVLERQINHVLQYFNCAVHHQLEVSIVRMSKRLLASMLRLLLCSHNLEFYRNTTTTTTTTSIFKRSHPQSKSINGDNTTNPDSPKAHSKKNPITHSISPTRIPTRSPSQSPSCVDKGKQGKDNCSSKDSKNNKGSKATSEPTISPTNNGSVRSPATTISPRTTIRAPTSESKNNKGLVSLVESEAK